MEISRVYDLMDRFENSNIASMKLEMEGIKLSLTKDTVQQNGEGIENRDALLKKETIEEHRNKKEEKTAGFEVKAPLTGTFYQAASPEEEPFAVVGKKVAKGDVIGIIEAMKMMNEVISPIEGEIMTINVSDGEMVEYDQVLITIKES